MTQILFEFATLGGFLRSDGAAVQRTDKGRIRHDRDAYRVERKGDATRRFRTGEVAPTNERRARTGEVPTPMAPPVSSEQALAKVFREESLEILVRLDKLLIAALPELMAAGRRELGKDPIPVTDGTRLDVGGAYLTSIIRGLRRSDAFKKVDVISDFVQGMEFQYGAEFELGRTNRRIVGVQSDLEAISESRWASSITQSAVASTTVPDALGPFLIAREPTIPVSTSNKWVERNVRLVRSEGTPRVPRIPQKHFKVLERTVRIAVHTGIRPEETIKAIQNLEGVTARRAEVIARDQVGKHNGTMNRLRHQQVGITRYRWRTVGDDAVRDAHETRNGVIFEYANPPPDGNPGEPVQCRCWAEPVLEDVLGEDVVESATS